MSRSSGQFTIDDAFEFEDDDPIRVYGATTEKDPRSLASQPTSKTRPDTPGDQKKDDIIYIESDIQIEPNECQERQLLPGVKHARAGVLRNDSTASVSNQSDVLNDVSLKILPDSYWWNHPKIRENWRVVLGSFLLLLLGIACLIAGIVIEVSKSTAIKSFVFFIAGAILLIPGVYHVVYICCAVHGKKGFSFYNLPVFR